MINNEALDGIPLLVVANKQDLKVMYRGQLWVVAYCIRPNRRPGRLRKFFLDH